MAGVIADRAVGYPCRRPRQHEPRQHVGLEAGELFRAHRHPMLTQIPHQRQTQPAPLDFTPDDTPSSWARSFHGGRARIRTTRRPRADFSSPGPGLIALSSQSSDAQEPGDYCSPINCADFGLTWNLMGMVSLDNTLTIHAVFTRR